MESKSISMSDRRKLESDIMPLAVFQLSSLYPFMIRMHSHTVCTCFGGFAKDLARKGSVRGSAPGLNASPRKHGSTPSPALGVTLHGCKGSHVPVRTWAPEVSFSKGRGGSHLSGDQASES